jgi:hypothetical protein
MREFKNAKKIHGTSTGSSPKLALGLWSGIISHGPPVGRLCFLLLSQQRVDVRELLLLLLVPLGRTLHVSVKCILNLTCAEFQPSEAGVDAVQLLMV